MKTFLSLVLLCCCIASQATIYYSNPAGGTFSGTIWSLTAGGPYTVAGSVISSTADDVVIQGGTITATTAATLCRNMTIQNGATVTTAVAVVLSGDLTIQSGGIFLLGPIGSNTGSLQLQNLYINSGGKLWGNDPVNSGATNIKTVRINGTTLQCDGTIGDGANSDALLIQPEGVTVTITGAGAIDVSRIRKGAATNAVTTLIIDANINVRLATTCIYNNQNTTTFNITVNQGKTLKCISITNPTGFPGTEGSISVGGTTGGSSSRQGLITINGTLECENLYVAANNAANLATDIDKYLVGSTGTLKVNTQLKGNNTTVAGAATADLQLQAGGVLQLGGAVPTATIDGIGTKNHWTFDPASTVTYTGVSQAIENNFGAYGQLVIAGSGNKTLQAATIAAGITIQSGAVLDATANNYALTVSGNWQDNNTTDGFAENNTTVTLNGTTAQTISGNETFYNLAINNAAGVSLAGNTTVSNALQLNGGIINTTAANLLSVINGATNAITGGSATSYINGPVKWLVATNGVYTFPVGNSSRYAYVNLSNTNTATTFTVSYTGNAYSSLTATAPFHVSGHEYWTINPDVAPAAVSITLSYSNGTFSQITNPSLLTVAHYSGTAWSNLGATAYTGTATAGSVSASASSFGVFTFGSSSTTNALPVTLVSFKGQLQNNNILLNWTTATELDLSRFAIERSADGISFAPIGSVNAANNATGASYTYTDDAILNGKNYYRLSMIESDGSYSYSNTIMVQTASAGVHIFYSRAVQTLIINTLSVAGSALVVYDMQGRVMQKANLTGNAQNQVPVTNLPAGVYVAAVVTKEGTTSLSFVK